MKINPSIFFLELQKENQYLLGFLAQENVAENRPKTIFLVKFKFISTEEKPKVDINSFNIILYSLFFAENLLDSRISCIELKNANIICVYLAKDNFLYLLVFDKENSEHIGFSLKLYLKDDYFFKLIFLKDQKGFIFFSDDNVYGFSILDFQEDYNKIKDLEYYGMNHDKYEGTYHYCMDVMAFRETKIIILS